MDGGFPSGPRLDTKWCSSSSLFQVDNFKGYCFENQQSSWEEKMKDWLHRVSLAEIHPPGSLVAMFSPVL